MSRNHIQISIERGMVFLAALLPLVLWGPQFRNGAEFLKIMGFLLPLTCGSAALLIFYLAGKTAKSFSAHGTAQTQSWTALPLAVLLFLTGLSLVASLEGHDSRSWYFLFFTHAAVNLLPFLAWTLGRCLAGTAIFCSGSDMAFWAGRGLLAGSIVSSILFLFGWPGAAGSAGNANLAGYIALAGMAVCKFPGGLWKVLEILVWPLSAAVILMNPSRGVLLALTLILLFRRVWFSCAGGGKNTGGPQGPVKGNSLFSLLFCLVAAALLSAPMATLMLGSNGHRPEIEEGLSVLSIERCTAEGQALLSPLDLNPAGSAAARISWWRAGLELAKDSPLLGFGPGSFRWKFWSTWNRIPQMPSTRLDCCPENPHSLFVRFSAESGFPAALAALLWVSFAGLWILKSSRANDCSAVTDEPVALWLFILWIITACFTKFWSSGPMCAVIFCAALGRHRNSRAECQDSAVTTGTPAHLISVAMISAIVFIALCPGFIAGRDLTGAEAELLSNRPHRALEKISESPFRDLQGYLLQARAMASLGSGFGALGKLYRLSETGLYHDHPGLLTALSALQSLLGIGEEALESALRAVQRAPFSVETRLAFGKALADQGRFDLAWEQSDQALLAHPDHPLAYLLRARLEALTGKTGDAVTTCENILSRAADLRKETLKKGNLPMSGADGLDLDNWLRAAQGAIALGGRILLQDRKSGATRKFASLALEALGPLPEVRALVSAAGGRITGSDCSEEAPGP